MKRTYIDEIVILLLSGFAGVDIFQLTLLGFLSGTALFIFISVVCIKKLKLHTIQEYENSRKGEEK